MTRSRVLIVVCTIAALPSVTGPAFAADRVSGVITRTFLIVDHTDLAGDVTCDVGAAACFSFAAPDVELRLNGFTISGKADAINGCDGAISPGEVGISTNGRSNVVVRGPGMVQRFRNHGISVAGSTNVRVEGLTVSTNCGSGVFVAATGFGTLVQDVIAVRNGTSAPGLSCGGIYESPATIAGSG